MSALATTSADDDMPTAKQTLARILRDLANLLDPLDPGLDAHQLLDLERYQHAVAERAHRQ